mgnify:CR=1 FL=1
MKMSVTSRLKTSVNKAVKAGVIDRKKHGAAIEAALKLAAVMDAPGWPIIDKRYDNVTPSTFLKYCQVLHLTPGEIIEEKQEDSMVGNSKWKKTDNGA